MLPFAGISPALEECASRSQRVLLVAKKITRAEEDSLVPKCDFSLTAMAIAQ